MSAKKRSRPEVVESRTYGIPTNCGKLFIRVGQQDGKIIEVFLQLGKSGCCQRGFLEALSFLLSDICKYEEVDLKDKKDMIGHLLSVNCPQPFVYKGEKYLSCSDLIAKVILKELEGESETTEAKKE